MVLSLGACAKPAEEEKPAGNAYTPGTYTQEVSGRNGKMVIDVTFTEDKIEKVEIVSEKETKSIAKVAMDRIPSQIVEHQTTNVDTVTGATITSYAIVSAVKNAVKEAGGDQTVLDAVTTARATAQETIEKTADVIVVGGGGAGMSAAVSAMENEASVILIEKTSMLGGNTVLAGGAMNAVDTEWEAGFEAQPGEKETLQMYASLDEATIPAEYLEDFKTMRTQINDYLASGETYHFDSVELHTIQTWYNGLRTNLDGEDYYGNYDLVSTMTKKANDAINWLGDLGVKWDTSKVTQPVGAMWVRGHNPSMPKGEEYVAVLEPMIQDKGEIMYETAATELIMDGSKVVGVKAVKADGTEVILHANKNVVLATGGYGANTKMVQQYNNYWTEIPNNIGTTNASGLDGDGIVMGQAAGAALAGMEFAQLMPIADPETGDLFTGIAATTTSDYFFVNKEGKRFVDETAARDTLAKAALENGGEFFMLVDMDVAEECIWTDWREQVEDGNAYMADTLEELASMMGLNEEQTKNFLEEVEKYNSYVESGVDPEFGKPIFNHKFEKAPFFASPRKPAIHHTMGGLVIDNEAHVLNAAGEAIEGLYAAGEVAGGVHAGNRLGGNAIADCFVYGRIAGENAAK